MVFFKKNAFSKNPEGDDDEQPDQITDAQTNPVFRVLNDGGGSSTSPVTGRRRPSSSWGETRARR